MPDSIGTHRYYGKLHQKWGNIKNSKAQIIRAGGIAPDENFFTNYQLLRLIDSIRSVGAEPIIQVPLWGGTFSAANAANIVEFVNITNSKNIKYWSIGNEPNLVYNDASHGFTAGSYTPTTYANHVKNFSIAMKTKDASIKIIAGELAWYDYTWVNSLFTLGGAADITGNNGTFDYVDFFSFHTYPFAGTQTRSDITNSVANFGSNLTHLNGKISAANSFHTRLTPLKYGITEFNINYQNPASNTPSGLGTQGFLVGQWASEMFAKALTNGAQFMCFWSVVEGGDGASTDFGFLSHTTGNLRATYHHFKNLAQYIHGTYYNVSTGQSLVRGIAAKDENGFAVLMMNYEQTTGFSVRIRLNNNAISGTENIKMNVNANLAKEGRDTLPPNSTAIFLFSPSGNYIGKIRYALNDATNDITPSFDSYNPNRAKKVFAHYLPWYDNGLGGYGRSGWCHEVLSGDCSNLSRQSSIYNALIGEYSQYDSEVLKYHIRQAIAARIDGFLVNLNPLYTPQWQIFHKLCEAVLAVNAECAGNNFKLAISYDNGNTDLPTITQNFQKLEDSLYKHTIYKNLVWKDDYTGNPIVIVWSEANWTNYRTALDLVFGKDSVIALGRNAVSANLLDGNFEWVNNLNTGTGTNTINWGQSYFNDFNWLMARQLEYMQLKDYRSANTVKMGNAYPGFDDANVPPFWNGGTRRYIQREVNDGNTYDLTWNKQITYQPLMLGGEIEVYNPWVQITTWNDFPEGTCIEPTIAAQFGYKALQQTRTKVAQFKGISTSVGDTLGIYVPYEIYKAAKESRNTAVTNALPFFCAKDYTAAYNAARVGALPIELVHFAAKTENKETVSLNWQVANALNFSHFEVEYSQNGNEFSAFSKINYTEKENTYNVIHEFPKKGDNFYRLKMVDFDGSFAYSEIKTVHFEDIPAIDLAYFAGVLSVKLNENKVFSIAVFDEMGRMIFSNENISYSQEIDFQHLANGVYNVQVREKGRKMYVFRFVK